MLSPVDYEHAWQQRASAALHTAATGAA
jgi:hypothetical protein